MRVGLPSPATQMRLELMKMRRKGLGFEFAWKRALERIKWPEDKASRDEWKAILASGREVWQDAYIQNGNQPKGIEGLRDFFLPDATERQPLEVLA